MKSDKVFAGSVPRLYEEYLVPLIFQPYAEDLANRLVSRHLSRVLEIAAGTGVVTRRLASVLPKDVSIVATDLNQPMLDTAAEVGTSRPVEWREADAMQLPFDDGEFDAVVCGFGVMFFPSKSKAFSEARRVLRPGGVFLFSAWDRIEENVFANDVTDALATFFPDDPPRFMARTPHGYHDIALIKSDLAKAGFKYATIETVKAESRAPSARDVALAYCQGTPLRNEIEARGPGRLEAATDHAASVIASRHGNGKISAKIQAHVVLARI